MENLHLHLTPVELHYRQKEPVVLSCLVKKVAISTGHMLEKRQIQSNQQQPGRAYFQKGVTFPLNKEMETSNTKISLHFMAKKDRNISCIGSADIDVASLPLNPKSTLQLKLNHCSDPQAKVKLQINRNNKSQLSANKADRYPQQMGLLQTEGQQKQKWLQKSRRINPNIPTAYQISHRNYKQVEMPLRSQKQSMSNSNSSSRNNIGKGSYQKRYQAIVSQAIQNITPNVTIDQIKNSHKDTSVAQKFTRSPKPRRNTPEPIPIGTNKPQKKTFKCPTTRDDQTSKFTISSKMTAPRKSIPVVPYLDNTLQQASQEMPSKLVVTPYERQQQNNRNYNKTKKDNQQSSCSENSSKYKSIADKLQRIQDKIMQSKDQFHHQSHHSHPPVDSIHIQAHSDARNEHAKSVHNSKIFDYVRPFNQHSQILEQADSRIDSVIIQQPPTIVKQLQQTDRKIIQQKKIHNLVLVTQIFDQTIVNQDLAVSYSFKEKALKLEVENRQLLKKVQFQVNQKSIAIRQNSNQQAKYIQLLQQKQLIINLLKAQTQSLRSIQYELSKPKLKISIQSSPQHKTNTLNNQSIEDLKAQLADKENQVCQLMEHLQAANKKITQKQTLLTKINNQYYEKFDQIKKLQEKYNKLNQQKIGLEETLREIMEQNNIQNSNTRQAQQNNQKIRQQLQKQLSVYKNKNQDQQRLIKLKQNENKMLRLQIDNLKRDYQALQKQVKEINVLQSKEKHQLMRQRSLALIHQASATAINEQNKKQNQNLRYQVKILQQKLEQFNKMFQQLIGQNWLAKSKNLSSVADLSLIKLQQKFHQIEQRCGYYQQELKVKKNLMAEMINIIWKYQQPRLMAEIDGLITQSPL